MDVAREQLRDPRAGFIAYVPVGSVAKGRLLADKLGCASCHGEGLLGAGRVSPAIAGRSPSYLARQLYDFQQGARRGQMATAMLPVTTKLTAADIVNLAAYTAALPAKK
jgi:cytochrome c553